MRLKSQLLRFLFIASLTVATPARAIDYIIEVVLFENLSAVQTMSAPALYVPQTTDAFRLTSSEAAQADFTLLETNLNLTDSAEALKQSDRYAVLAHFAWQQPGLDDANAQAIRISNGSGIDVYIPEQFREFPDFIPASLNPTQTGAERQVTTTTIDGTLKVRLGRFLHLDTRLVFTDIRANTSFRMLHSRKMRSRELHYIDNPRFGLLVKIIPAPEQE